MIPPFQQYLYPFLKLMGDGKVRNISQVSEDLGKEMNLTEEELSETYETSGQNRHRGWQVEAVYLGNPMRHDEKYLLINQGLAGKQRLVPFFNRSNNEDLILAIQSAGVSRGRNGFRKDKSGEKLAESEEDLLEHRTDAFDTLYIGAENFRIGRRSACRQREFCSDCERRSPREWA